MKTWTIRLAFLAFVFLCGYAWHEQPLQAQAATAAPWQVAVAGAHTLCTPVAATTTFCFAQDGAWQSINGGAFTQLGASSGTVVTSWNGKTGDVVYTAPVTSVNSKTGAVTLSIQ